MNNQQQDLAPEYKEALVELLFQLADDDFFYAYRSSEWLGLAPHVEEDVAYSSISQDSMGHAVIFYQLLESLGVGNADALAHGRSAKERRNAVLLELVNGPGNYMIDAQYDWAFTVVRNYFYTQAKKVKIDSLKNSSYEPLTEVATKINMELYYHLLHWKTWFVQLLSANDEAKRRMMEAIEKVADEFQGIFEQGVQGGKIIEFGLIEDGEVLKARWNEIVTPVFQSLDLALPKEFKMKQGNGRNGQHTEDIASAIATLSEVYISEPNVTW